jgi:hypothetical protein
MKLPRMALVVQTLSGLRTPRIVMHECAASTTTPTPRGSFLHDQVGQLLRHAPCAGSPRQQLHGGPACQTDNLAVGQVADMPLPMDGGR